MAAISLRVRGNVSDESFEMAARPMQKDDVFSGSGLERTRRNAAGIDRCDAPVNAEKLSPNADSSDS